MENIKGPRAASIIVVVLGVLLIVSTIFLLSARGITWLLRIVAFFAISAGIGIMVEGIEDAAKTKKCIGCGTHQLRARSTCGNCGAPLPKSNPFGPRPVAYIAIMVALILLTLTSVSHIPVLIGLAVGAGVVALVRHMTEVKL